MDSSSDVNMLIRRSLAGDEGAFANLFDQYKNLVFKTAYLMLGSTEEAEDVLQEVFLEVHRSLSSYQASKAAFSTWLHQITVNDCISWQRKWRRGWKRGVQTLISLSREHEDIAAPGHEQDTEDLDSIREALAHISDKLRSVVVLRFYWDLSYAEIAQALNVPIGTVKSRLNKALEIMRDGLQVQAKPDAAGLDQWLHPTTPPDGIPVNHRD